VEQLLSRVCGQLVEHVAGRVRKGSAEAENFLKSLFRIECDDLCRGLAGGLPPRDSGDVLKTPLLIGHPNCDFTRTRVAWAS